MHFREEILARFLDQYLREGAPKADVALVTAFETGTNKWRRLPGWPSPGTMEKRLYLQAEAKVGFTEPSGEPFTEYVSDPAKPVPFR